MERGKLFYVAVGKDDKDRKSTLQWALNKANQDKSLFDINPFLCVFYVNVPIDLPNELKEKEVKSFREKEEKKAVKILEDCGRMCKKDKVPCQTFKIQSESITKGIFEHIDRLWIRRLVMGAGGAAANSKYDWRMTTPMSSITANSVLRFAPGFCHIWFVRNDQLVYTREGQEMQARHLTENPERYQLDRFGCPEFFKKLLPCETAGGSSSSFPSMHRGFSPTSTMVGNTSSSDLLLRSREISDFIDRMFPELPKSREELKELPEKVFVKQRRKAEKEATGANIKLLAAKKDMIRMAEKLTDTKTKLEKALQELCDASGQLTSFESQNKEMRRELDNSINTQKMYKKLCDSQQKKLDTALHLAQGSTNCLALEQLSLDVPLFSCEFSMVDLEEATNSFDQSLKIGEGGYGDVYRGFLNHTDVAIKKLNPDSLQGPAEFKQEVDILSKLRHPNLVTLIGTSTESRCLIYEYLPNGSLQDRLICKENTPPLPWQTRIQIATQLCSVLKFLHSRQPNSIIHADVNPLNVLLDANFICKLSGFGSCHVISNDEDDVTPKTDVYSFGMILLYLLTAEYYSGIVEKVQYALEIDDFHNILDHSAGEWPFVRATQLAHLALRCCNMISDDRPDLASEVWMLLKPTNDPSRSLSKPLRLVSEEQIPSYFICPILQEIMHDPQFAADGYTYEANAIKTWFEGGHNTSPMNNLRLANLLLTPNHALHSAILEWWQKYQCV